MFRDNGDIQESVAHGSIGPLQENPKLVKLIFSFTVEQRFEQCTGLHMSQN